MSKITNCIICNKEIEYKTKKPDKCQECKGNKPLKTKWKHESSIFKVLHNLFKDIVMITNGYYSFLPSPKGSPMQLDWYCPELQLAVEVQGAQHYKYSKYFSKSKKKFYYLQECDKLKEKLCEELNITLLHIKYNEQPSAADIIFNIYNKNPNLINPIIKYSNITKKEINRIIQERTG